LISSLVLSAPAQAQLDGAVDEFEPAVEQMPPDDAATKQEIQQEVESAAPAPGTLDKPRTGARLPYNPSSDDKVFDWEKHQGQKEVPHPFAEKGLLRITRDKTYIYRVKETEQKTATAIRFGPYVPENLEAPAGAGAVSTFDDNYDQTDTPAILLDWEWQLWKSPIGKFGLAAGGGVYVAQGNGHFAGTNNVNAGLTPKEIFTLIVMPFSAGAVYRMQFWDRQLFVPYGAGGGMLFGVSEFRDDNKPPKWGGAYGLYYAAGVAMSLSYFDAISKIQLDMEYGINAVYLTAEYRRIVGLSTLDFSADMANGGFLIEY